MGFGRPPRRDNCIQNIIHTPFISMVRVVLTTKTQIYTKEPIWFNKKNYSDHAEYFFLQCP